MEIESKISNLDRAVAAYRGTPLSAIEVAAIRGSCAGQTYEEIATATQYSVSYLSRTFCPQLWQLLSAVCGVSIGKKNLLTVLESLDLSAPKIARIDWGEAIDVSEFQGRAEELATLATWTLEGRCRTIEILGMGGVGKTALSVKLCQQVGSEFEYAIWRSLRNAPPLATLLADLVSFLSDRQEIAAEPSKLFDLLRQSRCLVVLDNLETLLDAERVGQFRAGFEGYGELLRSLAEVAHQSCIIFTSREKPAAIAALGGEGAAVRSLRLDGSPEATQFILHSKQLIGTAAQKQLLGDRYGNNPLPLKIVATSIQELFDRQIGDFLQEDTLVFNGIRHLLVRVASACRIANSSGYQRSNAASCIGWQLTANGRELTNC